MPTKIEVNVNSGEIIEREMNQEEVAEMEAQQERIRKHLQSQQTPEPQGNGEQQ